VFAPVWVYRLIYYLVILILGKMCSVLSVFLEGFLALVLIYILFITARYFASWTSSSYLWKYMVSPSFWSVISKYTAGNNYCIL